MRQRDKAFRKARRSKLRVDWEFARNLRNTLSMDIKTSKSNVIKGKLERYGNNSKKFWAEINKLIPQSDGTTIRSIHDEETGNI